MKARKAMFTRSLFIFVIILLLPFRANGYASEYIDQIKIGIRFASSAKPMVTLASSSGLELGFYSGNEFVSMMDFYETKEIIVRKDGCFKRSNGSFIECDYSDTGDVEGPIHIQIGDKFDNRSDAEEFIKSLPSFREKPYIVYEDGFRVFSGLYTSYAYAEEAMKDMQNIFSGIDLKIISQNSKRVQVLDPSGNVLFMYNTEGRSYNFKPIDDFLIQVDDKKFRGSIIINRYSDSDLTIINQLGLEEYLYGVVPKEVSSKWPIESQKAQAVAARSYTIMQRGKYSKYGFDLSPSTSSQVYGGYTSENPRSNRAVDETKGKVITYNGKVVTTFYHSNSGGHTENSENYWSSKLGYLRGVEDHFSIGLPNAKWTKVYTKEQIENRLSTNGIFVGSIENIRILERSNNGRVLKLEIQGSEGNKVLEKSKIRSILGNTIIKSTWFDIVSDKDGDASLFVLYDLKYSPKEMNMDQKYILSSEDLQKMNTENQYVTNGEESKLIENETSTNVGEYVFEGKGYGHGIGMSQWGAKKMAEEGFTFEQILEHYYTGIKVK